MITPDPSLPDPKPSPVDHPLTALNQQEASWELVMSRPEAPCPHCREESVVTARFPNGQARAVEYQHETGCPTLSQEM